MPAFLPLTLQATGLMGIVHHQLVSIQVCLCHKYADQCRYKNSWKHSKGILASLASADGLIGSLNSGRSGPMLLAVASAQLYAQGAWYPHCKLHTSLLALQSPTSSPSSFCSSPSSKDSLSEVRGATDIAGTRDNMFPERTTLPPPSLMKSLTTSSSLRFSSLSGLPTVKRSTAFYMQSNSIFYTTPGKSYTIEKPALRSIKWCIACQLPTQTQFSSGRYLTGKKNTNT